MNLLKIWKNKGKILEGIKNNIFKSEHVEEIANERFEYCKKCPDVDTKGDKCEIPGTQPCCGKCGCSLQIALRSLSYECPVKKWGPVLSEEEEDALEEYLNNGK
jgi:hypothetical protein